MADQVPGLPGYKRATDPADAPPKQTVFPKSQGTGGAAPAPPTAPISALPGYQRATNPPAPATGSTPADSQGDGTWSKLGYDIFHPQPANLDRPQTWRDWVTKTYSPTARDYGNAALDDVSFGTADLAQAKLTGGNLADIRARTANSQAALGPMGPIVNALTYAIPGTGEMKMVATPGKLINAGAKLANAGRYGTAAIEGGVASGLSSAGHQAGDQNGPNWTGIDPVKVGWDTVKGAALSPVVQAGGDLTAPAIQRVGTYVTGKPGVGGEQWPGGTNWRDQAASDPDAVRANAAAQQALLPADDPAQPALSKAQGALAQSTDPGIVAHGVTGLGSWGASHYLGADDATQAILGVASPFASKYFVNKPAEMINTADRNINVGQSMDQLYPALTGNKPSVTDTSGWANFLRQGWIGGDRPTDAAGDAQWF